MLSDIRETIHKNAPNDVLSQKHYVQLQALEQINAKDVNSELEALAQAKKHVKIEHQCTTSETQITPTFAFPPIFPLYYYPQL